MIYRVMELIYFANQLVVTRMFRRILQHASDIPEVGWNVAVGLIHIYLDSGRATVKIKETSSLAVRMAVPT